MATGIVDMADCGTLTVERAFDPSLVEVSACTEDWPAAVTPGQSVSVRAMLDNGNDVSATVTVVVTADGQEVGRANNVGVPATGGQTGITITAPGSTGDYDISAEIAGDPQPSAQMAADGGKPAGLTRLNTCTTCR